MRLLLHLRRSLASANRDQYHRESLEESLAQVSRRLVESPEVFGVGAGQWRRPPRGWQVRRTPFGHLGVPDANISLFFVF